ncbi:MAG: hypothetical protein WEB87_05335 [Bacteriovoracaceae bacterium]
MSEAINIFISLGILTLVGVFALRLWLQKRGMSYLSVLVWLMLGSVSGFIVFDLAYKWEIFREFAFFPIENALLLLFEFSYFAILIFALIQKPDSKKMKTLMRLPIIGALLGWYLPFVQVAAIFALVEIAGAFLLARRKERLPFFWRAHLKGLFAVPLLSMYSLPTNLWFSSYLLWSLVFKLVLVNAAIVKKAMVDYDKTL